MSVGQILSGSMEEISELENRLKDALAVIDAAISDREGVADIVELRQQNAELKAGIDAAEQAAAKAEVRLAETVAELDLAKHISGAAADTGEVVESISRAHSGLDGQLQVVQARLEDALGQISDLANQVQNLVQIAASQSSADTSRADRSEVEAEMERLRQTRQDDVNHINGILEKLLPLVEGERGA